jgi:hypothetical protein
MYDMQFLQLSLVHGYVILCIITQNTHQAYQYISQANILWDN